MNNFIKKESLLVGILANPDYRPSLLASTYIQQVLGREGIRTCLLSLEDIMKGHVNCHTIFNVYYGDIGDNGTISGILNRNGLAFVGNDQYTCSLMINKIISKIIFKQFKYLTPPFWYQPNAQKENLFLVREIEKTLRYPLLAKPVNGAASENISYIDDDQQLEGFIIENRDMLDSGYYFFEQFIRGRELSAGYVNAVGVPLPVVEICLKGEKYQSNKVKFSPGLKENIIPAKIGMDVYKKAQATAQELNSIFHCRAFSRTDMIYDDLDQKLYLLEINTNPGLLEKSLLPQMCKVAQIGEGELFLKLIYYSLN